MGKGQPMSLRKRKVVKSLPDKLSDGIDLALDDLEAIEKLPDCYIIDMGTWHTPHRNKCLVCLSGCVMSNTLELSINDDVLPSAFPRDVERKLRALDEVRIGNIEDAWQDWYGLDTGEIEDDKQLELVVKLLTDDIPSYLLESDFSTYEESPGAFKRVLRTVASMLRESGF